MSRGVGLFIYLRTNESCRGHKMETVYRTNKRIGMMTFPNWDM